KPSDNGEVPAHKFADLSDARGAAAILNDCKHGYSAKGNTIRLPLIRSSYNPDPRPNDRPQSAKWAFLPHAGPLDPAFVAMAAESFNHPLWPAPAKAKASGELPAE